MAGNCLRIGYIMQAESVDMSTVSGPQLHVEAVFQGFRKREHTVRMVAIQQNQVQWTDDLQVWHTCERGFSESGAFRVIERPIRGVQSRLKLPFFRLFDSYRFSDACVAALNGFDILYERFGTLSFGGLIAARRLGIPIVYEINGDLFAEYEQLGLGISRPQLEAIRLVSREMYQRGDHIVVVSEPLKQVVTKRWKVDSERITVITNGTEIDAFTTASPPDEILFNGLNGQPVVIFVGNFQPWHSVDLLLDAFAIVVAQTKAELILVGDSELRPELEAKAKSLHLGDSVNFAGKLPHSEVAKLLSAADIAVMSHRYSQASVSGTPLKLLEYMAAGKAIVAPRLPNLEQILTHRIDGLLVAPDSPQALAEGILELLDNPDLRQKMGRAARLEAVEKHSWDSTVAKLETLILKLVNERKA
jgi:glycosyltransferase involved in cell wall biosynthesis